MLDSNRRLTAREFARGVGDLTHAIIIIVVVHGKLNRGRYALSYAHVIHYIQRVIHGAENKV